MFLETITMSCKTIDLMDWIKLENSLLHSTNNKVKGKFTMRELVKYLIIYFSAQFLDGRILSGGGSQQEFSVKFFCI